MFNVKRLAKYLATGVMPEMTALDESLTEHDRKYHPDGYKEGDECNKRETMAGGDWVDKVEGQRSEVKRRNGSSSDRGNGVTAEDDAAYMDAVKRGDMETAQRMVREAAAKAMPDTKVVDDDGLPKVVYHDSGERHNVLSRDYARKSMDIEAVFFHLERDKYHEYGNVEHAVFLNIKNPANFKQAHDGFEYGSSYDVGVKQREKLQAKGYDGAMFSAEEMGGEELAEAFVFDSNQIKSADPVTYDDADQPIPLSRRFDFSSDDIRY